jgi:hypothetical protein
VVELCSYLGPAPTCLEGALVPPDTGPGNGGRLVSGRLPGRQTDGVVFFCRANISGGAGREPPGEMPSGSWTPRVPARVWQCSCIGGPRSSGGSLKYRWYPPQGALERRRGRKPKTTMSLSDHLNRGSDVSKRGDLCNLPQKSSPANNSWGREHLQAARAAHLPCQVYEGKKKRRV